MIGMTEYYGYIRLGCYARKKDRKNLILLKNSFSKTEKLATEFQTHRKWPNISANDPDPGSG